MVTVRTLLIWVLLVTCKALRDIDKRQQPNNAICLKNNDCASFCCVYQSEAYGMCVAQANIREVCGFISSPQLPVPEMLYSVCPASRCVSHCCCADKCCPTHYCVRLLNIKTKSCSRCSSGCCCNDRCCPLLYCHENLATLLESEKGVDVRESAQACTSCPSGCCCGDDCCLSLYCQGKGFGFQCQECPTGCCCGNICCSSRFCERQPYRPTDMLGVYHGLNLKYLPFLIDIYGPEFFRSLTPYYSYVRSEEALLNPARYQRLTQTGKKRQSRKMAALQIGPRRNNRQRLRGVAGSIGGPRMNNYYSGIPSGSSISRNFLSRQLHPAGLSTWHLQRGTRIMTDPSKVLRIQQAMSAPNYMLRDHSSSFNTAAGYQPPIARQSSSTLNRETLILLLRYILAKLYSTSQVKPGTGALPINNQLQGTAVPSSSIMLTGSPLHGLPRQQTPIAPLHKIVMDMQMYNARPSQDAQQLQQPSSSRSLTLGPHSTYSGLSQAGQKSFLQRLPEVKQREGVSGDAFKQVLSSGSFPAGQSNDMPNRIGQNAAMMHPDLSSHFNYFGASIATSTDGYPCLRCTTGCCCDFGCCGNGYCSSEQQPDTERGSLSP